MRSLIIFKTIFKIGIKNILQLTTYKILKAIRFYYLFMPKNELTIISFSYKLNNKFNIEKKWYLYSKEKYIYFMNNINKNLFYWFSSFKSEIHNPPRWFSDPYQGKNYEYLNNHWSLINEKEISDLKNIWELSRWNWTTTMARAWLTNGDKSYINYLNYWIKDWCIKNPSNFGINWICGQEASIRLINSLITWKLINNFTPNENTGNFEFFIIQHLKRISKTMLYAESQNNNHWVSEASALFIGGIWLETFTNKKEKGKYFEKKGRKHLERSISKLIMSDGSFSQYSTNYHRFLIDTITQVEWWRDLLNKKYFSNEFYSKCKSACLWLTKFINSKTGECPNIGGNDGVFCYQLHNLNYKNFKPSVQLSFIVFFKKFIYPDGPWDEPLYWLGLNKSNYLKMELEHKNNELLKEGGFVIFRRDPELLAILRIPKFNFRPSQADPMHFDLSIDGLNILRDGGTYSYNFNSKYFNYFSGIKSHNSAQFDEEEPMYRISKFLWGNWLEVFNKKLDFKIENNQIHFVSAYKSKNGLHRRKIILNEQSSKIQIIDHLSGFRNKATIRWRLLPTKWDLDGLYLKSKYIDLTFSSNQKIKSINLVKGFESNYYNEKKELPVLEINIDKSPCEFETIVKKNIF